MYLHVCAQAKTKVLCGCKCCKQWIPMKGSEKTHSNYMNKQIFLFSCSLLCSFCIASGAMFLNTTKRTVWLPSRCPAWWSIPSSRCCPSVTTGTYTVLLTARRPSCRTSPWTVGCWRLSTWERGAASFTGAEQSRQWPLWFRCSWELLCFLAPFSGIENKTGIGWMCGP